MKDRPHAPDPVQHAAAEGEAALFLLEALMLLLVERGVVDPTPLVEAVEDAMEAKRHLATEGPNALSARAAGVIARVQNTLLAMERERDLRPGS